MFTDTQYLVHYYSGGKRIYVDYSPYVSLETAREAANAFGAANPDDVCTYAVVVKHKGS